MAKCVAQQNATYGARTFDFPTKTRLAGTVASSRRRSDLYRAPPAQFVYDVWHLKPPDFNPQVFEPAPPKRNTRDAIRPWTYDSLTLHQSGDSPNASERRRNDKRRNDYFAELEDAHRRRLAGVGGAQEEERDELRLRFRMVDPDQARRDFVRTGVHKRAPYTAPQPHDYRQYPTLQSLGLPDFVTRFERDCLGLKSKNEGLSTLAGPPADYLRKVRLRTKADYEETRHPKWDSNLILPKLPFPNKIAAYTRHRRTDRSARSAFLERAENMMEKRARELEQFRAKLEDGLKES